jgi:hypothetical protein
VRGCSERESDVFGFDADRRAHRLAHPHLVHSRSIRSAWLVLTAGDRDRDFLRAWYGRYLRAWPRTGGRTILERFVLVPWCRGCDRCNGRGCPRDVV